MEIKATYSPCCKILREGINRPGVMHSGTCRQESNGKLGPTIALVDIDDVCRLAWENRGKFETDDACYRFIEIIRQYD